MRIEKQHREYFVAHYLSDIYLLGASDLRTLFPSSELLRESILGLTKSLVAFRSGNPAD